MLLLSWILFIPQTLIALSWQEYSPERHERFLSGYPAAPISNPDFLMAEYDLSGVGWESSEGEKTVALISPQHFLTAAHYQFPGFVSFLNRDGELKTYELSSYARIGETDVSIGSLLKPIPPGDKVTSYPIFSLNEESYRGEEVFYMGQYSAAGRTRIRGVSHQEGRPAKVFYGRRFDDAPHPDHVIATSGDSGSPSFADVDGTLALLGAHWMVNIDPYLPAYIKEINAVLAQEGYRLGVAKKQKAVSRRSAPFLPKALMLPRLWDGRKTSSYK